MAKADPEGVMCDSARIVGIMRKRNGETGANEREREKHFVNGDRAK